MKDKRFLIGAPAALLVLLGAASFFLMRGRKAKKAVALQKSLAEAERKKAQLEAAALAAKEEVEIQEQLKLPAVPKKVEMLRTQVREFVRKEPHVAAEVLRTWLEEPARSSGG